MSRYLGKILEQYTIKSPKEALLVSVMEDGEEDLILVFKGFSSSLMRTTISDPDVPLIKENTQIIGIDRILAPYNPSKPIYIEQNLTVEAIALLLENI